MLIIGSSQAVSIPPRPMLVIEEISKVFGRVRAVDNLSLSIPGGQFVGVIGRSGAGKSTLLRLLNRLTEPTGGRVLWDGTEVTALHGRKLRDWRRRCAMIFQQFNLVGRLAVMNNALMGRLAYAPAWQSWSKLWSRDGRIIAMAALDQFGLTGMAAQRAESLSGGQQQRVAICRALVQEPEIVLADEPVVSLDHRRIIIGDAQCYFGAEPRRWRFRRARRRRPARCIVHASERGHRDDPVLAAPQLAQGLPRR